jgi:branched-chain amino acid transport system substrate-binding protein
MYFPQASSGDETLAAMLGAAGAVGRSEGRTRAATLSCIEASICSRLSDVAPALAPKFGLGIVYQGKVSIAQPDYTASCQAAQAAGAQILVIAADANSLQRVARSCSSVSYRPLYVTGGSVALPSLTADAQLDGLVVGMNVMPPMVTSNNAVVEFQNALKQFAPGLQVSAGAITGWVSAKLFEFAAQALPQPPTSQSILDGLWSIKDNDLGGLTQPLTFTRGQAAPRILCYWLMQIKGGQYMTPDGGKRVCV